MTELQRIQRQIKGLLAARNYLLNQQPTDMVALSEVTERIVALAARLTAEASNPSANPLSDADVKALTKAVDDLSEVIARNAAARQIVKAVTALIKG
jgi:hypothetical protein